MPRPLDGACERALVLRTISRDAPADDLSFFGQELCQPVDFLEINEGDLFTAKTADFLPEKTPPPATGTARTFFVPIPASASILPLSLPLTLTVGPSLGASGSHQELKRDFFIGGKFFLGNFNRSALFGTGG